MTVPISDPVLLTYDLIRTNWNAANTSSVTPVFSSGWWDHGNERPQVTMTSHNEFGPGTLSQYTGIMGDGSGPFQRRQGLIFITGFAVRSSDRTISSPNPKQLVWEFVREAMRIVHANVYTGFPVNDFDQIASGDIIRDVLPDQTPTVYFAQVPLTYTRTETP